MKRLCGILLASTLVLGACGNNDSNSEDKKSNNTETKSVNENKTQFKDDTLVIDQAVLKIDDTFIINDKDSDDKLLAFKFHVKNKTNSEDITPTNVWIACFEATQDSENTVNKLDVGFTPNTGKFEEWDKHSNDVIKKGKTAKGIITYTLQNDEEVTLKATKGASGKKLGTKEIDLDDLKSEDYSLTGDLSDNSKKDKNESENTNSKNIASAKSDENKSAENDKTNNDSNDSSQQSSESATSDNSSSTNSSNNSQSTNNSKNNVARSNTQNNNSQSAQSNQNNNQQVNNQSSNTQEIPPTTHNESQMGYGRSEYEAAKEASSKVWDDPNAHVGGPSWVGKNEGYESWANRQKEVQESSMQQ